MPPSFPVAQAIVTRLGWTLLHSLWQVAAITLVLFAVLTVLRRRSPQAAYVGSGLALLLCMAATLATFVLIPDQQNESPRGNVSGTLLLTGTMDAPGNAEKSSPSAALPLYDRAPGAAVASADAVSPGVVESALSRGMIRIDPYLPWVVGVWVAGVLLMSAWNCIGWIAVRRLRTTLTTPVSSGWQQVAVRLSRQLGLNQGVELLQSTLVESPVVIGVWKPVILLPVSLVLGLAPEQLEALLAHELAHVLRRDYLVNLLQRGIETLLFYHPGIWWISRQVRLERENCCDDLAIAVTRDRASYAQALAAVAEARAPLTLPAASGGELLSRLQRLLGTPQPETTHPARGLAGLATLLVCGFIVACAAWPERTSQARADEVQADSKAEVPPLLARDAGRFELRVIDPDGKAVPNASIEIRTRPAPAEDQVITGQFLRTSDYGSFVAADDQGRLTVLMPVDPQRFELNITTPGYGPYWATWTSSDPVVPVPAHFTAELDAGWSAGGVILDEAGAPVSGVTVHPSIVFRKPPGELADLHVGVFSRTDAGGHWRFDSIPVSMKEVHVEINHADYRPLRRTLTRSEFDLEPGETPSAKIHLDQGITVSGNVTDDAGLPIVNALIRTKFFNDLREGRTDVDGIYRLKGCAATTARIVVSAPGKATDMQEVLIDADMDPVDFVMQPGGRIRIEVQDQAGKPIPKARVFYQRWRGDHFGYFELDHKSQYADDNGVWEWNEAPLDAFLADICSDEMQLENQTLIARPEPYVIRIPPGLVISGSVRDADTGEPIRKFRVVQGIRNSETHMNWVHHKVLVGSDGQYQLRIRYDRFAWLLRIEAEGFLPAVSRDIRSDEGHVTLNFALRKGKDVSAVVLTPNGEPAARARVALGVAGAQISVNNGDFDDGSTFASTETADDAGRFRFPPQEADYQLVAVHPQGYAHVTAAAEELATIQLEAWARVSGTYFIGKDPAANVPIWIDSSAVHSYGTDTASIFTHQRAVTGTDGRFSLDRVFAGKARIGRELSISGQTGFAEPASACMTAVTFHAGEQTEIDLGGHGTAVIGRLQPPVGFDEQINWKFAWIDVMLDLPVPPRPQVPEVPPEIRNDAAQAAAWERAWRRTDAAKTLLSWEFAVQAIENLRAASPSFSASVDRDGRFRIDDMPAGNYLFSVQFYNQAGLSLRNYRFSVNPNESEERTPVDLGTLVLQ